MDSGSESPTTPSLDWIESAVHSPLEGNPLHDLDDETLTVEGVKGLLIRGAIHDMPAAMSNNFRNLGLERLRKLLAPIMMRWLWKRIVQRTRERKVGFQKPEHVVREELGMRRLALDALAAEGTLTEVWPADVKERLVQSCGYLKHRRDEEIIVHEGESGISGVFVLVSGKVDLAQRKRMPPRRNSATITREVFESKQAPRLFGDWLAMTNDTHPCSVISRGDTGWWVLPKEDLVRFIHSPEFPASARREIAATLRQRQMARFLARCPLGAVTMAEIKSCPLFSCLTDYEASFIAGEAVPKCFQEGDILCDTDSVHKEIFFISSGTAEWVTCVRKGEEERDPSSPTPLYPRRHSKEVRWLSASMGSEDPVLDSHTAPAVINHLAVYLSVIGESETEASSRKKRRASTVFGQTYAVLKCVSPVDAWKVSADGLGNVLVSSPEVANKVRIGGNQVHCEAMRAEFDSEGSCLARKLRATLEHATAISHNVNETCLVELLQAAGPRVYYPRDAITTQSESASGLVILVKGKARRELYGDTATFGDRNQPVYELDGLQCLQASPGRWGTVLTAETICDAWFIPRATAVSIITSHHGDAIQQRIAQASLMRKLSFHSQSRHRLSSGSPLHTSWCSSMDPNSPRVVHSPILSSTNDPPFEGAPLDCRRNSTRNSFRNLARQRKQSTQSLAAHPGVNRRSSYGSPAGSPVLHSTSRPLPTFDSISSPCHAYQMRSPSLVSYHAANSSNLDPGPAAGDAGEAFVALKRGSSISICANLPKRLSPSFGSPSFGSPSFGSPSFGHDTEYLALSPRTAQKGLAVTFAATERTEEPDSTYNKQSQLISNVRRSSSFVERVAVMLQGQGSTEGDKLQNRLNAIVSKTEGMPKVNPPAALISPRRALEADEMHRYATRRVLDVRLVVAEPFVKKADRVNEEKRRRQRRRRKKKMRDASSQSTEEAEEEKEMDETCGSASAAEAASDASSTASSTLIDVLDEEEALLLFPFDSDTAPHGAQTSQHRLTSPANSSHSTRVKAYNTPSRPAPGRPHPGTPKSANLLTGSQHRPTNRTPGGRPIGSSILIPSTVALEDAFQPQPASSKPSLASPSTGSAHRHIREARQLAQGSGNGPHSPPQAVTRPRSRGGRKTTSEAPRIASPARAHPRVQSSSARAARPEVCREESFEQAAISGVSRADDFEGTRDRLEQGTGAEPPVDGNGTATEVLGSTGVFSKAASDRKHAGTSQARSGSRGLTGACRQQHRQPKSSRSGPSQPILHPHLLGFQYGRSITPEGMAGAVGLCSPPLYSHANELTSPVSDIPATGYATLLAESCTPSPSASRDSASLQRFPQGVTLDDLLGRTVFDTNGPTLFAATCEASEQVTIQVVPNLSFKPDSLARWRPLQLSFPVSLSKKSQLKLRIAAAFAASNHRDKTPVTVQSLLKVHQGKPATLVLRELRDGDVILATFGKRQKRGRKRAPFDMIAGATV
ncbi:hypothetical protein DIPPA_27096 [Diplonema papillatum]|nr:hypothetical protein DIPPA_27096 [Diplonema papillatum]